MRLLSENMILPSKRAKHQGSRLAAIITSPSVLLYRHFSHLYCHITQPTHSPQSDELFYVRDGKPFGVSSPPHIPDVQYCQINSTSSTLFLPLWGSFGLYPSIPPYRNEVMTKAKIPATRVWTGSQGKILCDVTNWPSKTSTLRPCSKLYYN